MKILITGLYGFIGNNLRDAFREHHVLYGLDIVWPQKTGVFKTFSWNELDFIPSVDAIIHLAGKAHDTKNTSSEQEYFDINVGLTQKIFQQFLKSAATKFIFFSSVKAAKDSVTKNHLIEDILPNPQTPYGKSKLEAERYILSELGKWRGDRRTAPQDDCTKVDEDDWMTERNDKKVYILRPCMIHGPGNKGNLNLLYRLSQKGYFWPLGAFENKRSFCSIENLLYVVEQLIEKDIEPGIYQVADDEAISTNELVRLISASQGRKAKIWNIPKKPIEAIAKIGDFSPFPLNSERLKKLTESYVVSNQKIKKALGIEKMPFTAAEGLRKTLDSFRK